MPRKVLDSLLAKNAEQKKEISALIEAAEKEPVPVDYQERIVTFSETIAALNDSAIPADAKNALLKACIKRITYSRERGKRTNNQKGGWTCNPIQVEIELNI